MRQLSCRVSWCERKLVIMKRVTAVQLSQPICSPNCLTMVSLPLQPYKHIPHTKTDKTRPGQTTVRAETNTKTKKVQILSWETVLTPELTRHWLQQPLLLCWSQVIIYRHSPAIKQSHTIPMSTFSNICNLWLYTQLINRKYMCIRILLTKWRKRTSAAMLCNACNQ